MNTLKATQMTIHARGRYTLERVGTFQLICAIDDSYSLSVDQGTLKLVKNRAGSEPRLDSLFDVYTKDGCIFGFRSRSNMKFIGV